MNVNISREKKRDVTTVNKPILADVPDKDLNIDDRIRIFCRSPWKSVLKELPESGQLVLVALYTGNPNSDICGYKLRLAFYIKRLRYSDESSVIERAGILSENDPPVEEGLWIYDGMDSREASNIAKYMAEGCSWKLYSGDYGNSMGYGPISYNQANFLENNTPEESPDFWMPIPQLK